VGAGDTAFSWDEEVATFWAQAAVAGRLPFLPSLGEFQVSHDGLSYSIWTGEDLLSFVPGGHGTSYSLKLFQQGFNGDA